MERLAGADRSGAALRLGTLPGSREHDAELVADAMALAELRTGPLRSSPGPVRWVHPRRAGAGVVGGVIARHWRPATPDGPGSPTCAAVSAATSALAPGHDVTAVDLDPVHLWMVARNAARPRRTGADRPRRRPGRRPVRGRRCSSTRPAQPEAEMRST
ncbi:hypothetical protein HBB16_17875 [Pseudonocardia sp. MCCB 268]|nr:hypothetical protein [Pseudonocardia cytotoxica]